MIARSPLLIVLLFLAASCSSTPSTFQTTDADKIGIKSNKFTGTIFKSSYPQYKLLIADSARVNRFTPTENQIKTAEYILATQIQEYNKPAVNQRADSYIDKNLKKYFRQYVGFINANGDSLIHINFHWNKFSLSERLKGYSDSRLTYTSDYSIVLDGGSRYWNINVNLTTKILEQLAVNGEG